MACRNAGRQHRTQRRAAADRDCGFRRSAWHPHGTRTLQRSGPNGVSWSGHEAEPGRSCRRQRWCSLPSACFQLLLVPNRRLLFLIESDCLLPWRHAAAGSAAGGETGAMASAGSGAFQKCAAADTTHTHTHTPRDLSFGSALRQPLCSRQHINHGISIRSHPRPTASARGAAFSLPRHLADSRSLSTLSLSLPPSVSLATCLSSTGCRGCWSGRLRWRVRTLTTRWWSGRWRHAPILTLQRVSRAPRDDCLSAALQ